MSWWSGKTDVVASSTTHAEYIGQDFAARELEWILQFLKELGVKQEVIPDIIGTKLEDTTLYGDNQPAMNLARNPVNHKASKHIDVKHHRIRDLLKRKVFKLVYVPTLDNTADILTKGVDKQKFEKHRAGMGMIRVKEDSY